MKYKHAVMMVVLTIISSFYPPFYYRNEYTKTTNHYLYKYHLYPLAQTSILDFDFLFQLPYSYLGLLKLTNEQLHLLQQTPYQPIINQLLLQQDFIFSYLPRYLLYHQKYPTKTIETIIYEVHLQHDLQMTISYTDFYKHAKAITNPNSLLVLINKQNYLSPNFVPSLYNKLQLEAELAINKLLQDMQQLHYHFEIKSSYRSYSYQQALYNYNQSILTNVDKTVTKAGHSEHQSGLAVDLAQQNHTISTITEYIGYEYLVKHAHEYGFILRYPQHKEAITSIQYEPWHFRYVGKDIATIIYTYQWTLEEYHILYKDNFIILCYN